MADLSHKPYTGDLNNLQYRIFKYREETFTSESFMNIMQDRV